MPRDIRLEAMVTESLREKQYTIPVHNEKDSVSYFALESRPIMHIKGDTYIALHTLRMLTR